MRLLLQVAKTPIVQSFGDGGEELNIYSTALTIQIGEGYRADDLIDPIEMIMPVSTRLDLLNTLIVDELKCGESAI